MSAAFLAAAISTVFELGTADTVYRRAHVAENSDAGRIFEEQRPIVPAQLAGV